MKTTIPYKITGKQRKQLDEDISVPLHTIPKYMGYPKSMAIWSRMLCGRTLTFFGR